MGSGAKSYLDKSLSLEVESSSMPDLDEKVYALDTRVSNIEKDVSNTVLSQKYHEERLSTMENNVIKHMEEEESDRKAMEEKIDGIIRYKWMMFGAMVMLWLTSGNNEILKLLKVVF